MSRAIERLDDMATIFSPLIRPQMIRIDARWVFPFCLAISRRFDFLMNIPSSSTVIMSLRTHFCHGISGIPICTASSSISDESDVPVRVGEWSLGSIAPSSLGLTRLRSVVILFDLTEVVIDNCACLTPWRDNFGKDRGGIRPTQKNALIAL